MSASLSTRAAALRALHRSGGPLVLPNAWDAGSARAVAEAGFPAVATSSAAVAESLGHADGEHTPPDEMFAAVARITRAVPVPVTADLERGYGRKPDELVTRLLDAGAVGLNLEDSDPRTGDLVDAEEQADLLAGVRAAADGAGVAVVLNARVDVFLHPDREPADRLAEAIRRARRPRGGPGQLRLRPVRGDPRPHRPPARHGRRRGTSRLSGGCPVRRWPAGRLR
ncbi:isocitrate lyase/phosphoenolpyruvate mutase family protein [Micromonospora sp. NPDC000442]|uniref:isocitrate lyase/phosphoenolpyruvate mutase family protein n=1 Tax=Micromonospora sp. NPDC000442 TaxID=3364217 RepID=UPI00369D95EA